MLHNYHLVHYFGEFGYFNFVLLGQLENYFLKKNTLFAIATYRDYFLLLDKKFPNMFLYCGDFSPLDKDAKRFCHRIEDREFNSMLQTKGYIPFDNFLNCEMIGWKEKSHLITPIKIPFGSDSPKKNYISVACRKRRLQPQRNLSYEQWLFILKKINELYPNFQLVIHGLKEETIPVKDFIFCEDIVKSIDYLNESLFFVASMSGFAQFASNCCCSILQIGPEKMMIPYNPFEKINLCIEHSEIQQIQETLVKFMR